MLCIAVNVYAEVTVVGNKSIESQTVKQYAQIDDEGPVGDIELSRALKRIYKTGFFSDVKISSIDGDITIAVEETPVVKKIEFNGSKAIGKDKMLEEMQTKEKRFYAKTDIMNDVKRLKMIYQKMGFFNAKVTPFVEFVDDRSQVVVIINIKEGKKARIGSVNIVGNKHFRDGEIAGEGSRVKPRNLWRLRLGQGFDLEAVQSDQENIKRFYKQRGFPNVVIKNVVSEFVSKKNLFDVVVYIDEGGRYIFGKSDIKSFIEGFDKKKIKDKFIKNIDGKVFNINKIEQTVANIEEVLQESGFMFAKVDYEMVLKGGNIADVVYIIKNSRRVYLQSINIVGNDKTSDNVIRREMLVKEGDVYNVAKIRRSVQRLHNLQYFEDVQVGEKIIAGSGDRVSLTVSVKERSTASVNASIGFDQINGIAGSIGVRESNFLGEGYNAGISLEKTAVSQSYNISFAEPYFKGRDILLGGSVLHSFYGNPNFVAYNSRMTAFNLTMAYSVTEYLRHSINYRYQLDNVEENSSNNSPFIKAQIGNYTTSAISHTIKYDKRDNSFIPNDGFSLMFKQEFSGLGGNVKFISNEIRADWYKTLLDVDGLVFALKGRVASIASYGGSLVNVQSLYALGGGFGLRGFNYRGVGPTLGYLDGGGNVASYESFSYGGKNLQLLSAEMRFPNGIPKDLGLVTYLFADIGTLYGIDLHSSFDTTGVKIFDKKSYRASAGLGVSWRSPMGPIGFAFGRTLREEIYDQKLFFLITFGGTGNVNM
ncbi:MAG: outer membrane protein insertion porin family [Candidatus Deianiraeaceae bacterium]|jgi:outer membrane protein insertion porin family